MRLFIIIFGTLLVWKGSSSDSGESEAEGDLGLLVKAATLGRTGKENLRNRLRMSVITEDGPGFTRWVHREKKSLELMEAYAPHLGELAKELNSQDPTVQNDLLQASLELIEDNLPTEVLNAFWSGEAPPLDQAKGGRILQKIANLQSLEARIRYFNLLLKLIGPRVISFGSPVVVDEEFDNCIKLSVAMQGGAPQLAAQSFLSCAGDEVDEDTIHTLDAIFMDFSHIVDPIKIVPIEHWIFSKRGLDAALLIGARYIIYLHQTKQTDYWLKVSGWLSQGVADPSQFIETLPLATISTVMFQTRLYRMHKMQVKFADRLWEKHSGATQILRLLADIDPAKIYEELDNNNYQAYPIHRRDPFRISDDREALLTALLVINCYLPKITKPREVTSVCGILGKLKVPPMIPVHHVLTRYVYEISSQPLSVQPGELIKYFANLKDYQSSPNAIHIPSYRPADLESLPADRSPQLMNAIISPERPRQKRRIPGYSQRKVADYVHLFGIEPTERKSACDTEEDCYQKAQQAAADQLKLGMLKSGVETYQASAMSQNFRKLPFDAAKNVYERLSQLLNQSTAKVDRKALEDIIASPKVPKTVSSSSDKGMMAGPNRKGYNAQAAKTFPSTIQHPSGLDERPQHYNQPIDPLYLDQELSENLKKLNVPLREQAEIKANLAKQGPQAISEYLQTTRQAIDSGQVAQPGLFDWLKSKSLSGLRLPSLNPGSWISWSKSPQQIKVSPDYSGQLEAESLFRELPPQMSNVEQQQAERVPFEAYTNNLNNYNNSSLSTLEKVIILLKQLSVPEEYRAEIEMALNEKDQGAQEEYLRSVQRVATEGHSGVNGFTDWLRSKAVFGATLPSFNPTTWFQKSIHDYGPKSAAYQQSVGPTTEEMSISSLLNSLGLPERDLRVIQQDLASKKPKEIDNFMRQIQAASQAGLAANPGFFDWLRSKARFGLLLPSFDPRTWSSQWAPKFGPSSPEYYKADPDKQFENEIKEMSLNDLLGSTEMPSEYQYNIIAALASQDPSRVQDYMSAIQKAVLAGYSSSAGFFDWALARARGGYQIGDFDPKVLLKANIGDTKAPPGGNGPFIREEPTSDEQEVAGKLVQLAESSGKPGLLSWLSSLFRRGGQTTPKSQFIAEEPFAVEQIAQVIHQIEQREPGFLDRINELINQGNATGAGLLRYLKAKLKYGDAIVYDYEESDWANDEEAVDTIIQNIKETDSNQAQAMSEQLSGDDPHADFNKLIDIAGQVAPGYVQDGPSGTAEDLLHQKISDYLDRLSMGLSDKAFIVGLLAGKDQQWLRDFINGAQLALENGVQPSIGFTRWLQAKAAFGPTMQRSYKPRWEIPLNALNTILHMVEERHRRSYEFLSGNLTRNLEENIKLVCDWVSKRQLPPPSVVSFEKVEPFVNQLESAMLPEQARDIVKDIMDNQGSQSTGFLGRLSGLLSQGLAGSAAFIRYLRAKARFGVAIGDQFAERDWKDDTAAVATILDGLKSQNKELHDTLVQNIIKDDPSAGLDLLLDSISMGEYVPVERLPFLAPIEKGVYSKDQVANLKPIVFSDAQLIELTRAALKENGLDPRLINGQEKSTISILRSLPSTMQDSKTALMAACLRSPLLIKIVKQAGGLFPFALEQLLFRVSKYNLETIRSLETALAGVEPLNRAAAQKAILLITYPELVPIADSLNLNEKDLPRTIAKLLESAALSKEQLEFIKVRPFTLKEAQDLLQGLLSVNRNYGINLKGNLDRLFKKFLGTFKNPKLSDFMPRLVNFSFQDSPCSDIKDCISRVRSLLPTILKSRLLQVGLNEEDVDGALMDFQKHDAATQHSLFSSLWNIPGSGIQMPQLSVWLRFKCLAPSLISNNPLGWSGQAAADQAGTALSQVFPELGSVFKAMSSQLDAQKVLEALKNGLDYISNPDIDSREVMIETLARGVSDASSEAAKIIAQRSNDPSLIASTSLLGVPANQENSRSLSSIFKNIGVTFSKIPNDLSQYSGKLWKCLGNLLPRGKVKPTETELAIMKLLLYFRDFVQPDILYSGITFREVIKSILGQEQVSAINKPATSKLVDSLDERIVNSLLSQIPPTRPVDLQQLLMDAAVTQMKGASTQQEAADLLSQMGSVLIGEDIPKEFIVSNGFLDYLKLLLAQKLPWQMLTAAALLKSIALAKVLDSQDSIHLIGQLLKRLSAQTISELDSLVSNSRVSPDQAMAMIRKELISKSKMDMNTARSRLIAILTEEINEMNDQELVDHSFYGAILLQVVLDSSP